MLIICLVNIMRPIFARAYIGKVGDDCEVVINSS